MSRDPNAALPGPQRQLGLGVSSTASSRRQLTFLSMTTPASQNEMEAEVEKLSYHECKTELCRAKRMFNSLKAEKEKSDQTLAGFIAEWKQEKGNLEREKETLVDTGRHS